MIFKAYSAHKCSQNPQTRIRSLSGIILCCFSQVILWAQSYNYWIFLSYFSISFNLSTEASENLWSTPFQKYSAQNQRQYSCQGLTATGTLSMSCSRWLRHSPQCPPFLKATEQTWLFWHAGKQPAWPDVKLRREQREKLLDITHDVRGGAGW